MAAADGSEEMRVQRANTVISKVRFKSSLRKKTTASELGDTAGAVSNKAEFHAASKKSEESPAEKAFWFHSDWRREETARYLKNASDGAFVVRSTNSGGADDYVLSVQTDAAAQNKGIRHVLLKAILHEGKRWYNVAPTRHYFNNMYDLIWYCHTTEFSFGEEDQGIRLSKTSSSKADQAWKEGAKTRAKEQEMKLAEKVVHKASKQAKKGKLDGELWFKPTAETSFVNKVLAAGQPGAFFVCRTGEETYQLTTRLPGDRTFSTTVEKAQSQGATVFHVPPSPDHFEHMFDLVHHAESSALILDGEETVLNPKATKKALEEYNKIQAANQLAAQKQAEASSKKVVDNATSKKAVKADMAEQGWYRQGVTKEQVHQMLDNAARGAFVIYKTEPEDEQGKLTLAIQTATQNHIHESEMTFEDDKWHHVAGSNQRFEHLFDLATHGEKNPLPVTGADVATVALNTKASKKATDAYDTMIADQEREKREWQQEMLSSEDGLEFRFASVKAAQSKLEQQLWFRPWLDEAGARQFLEGSEKGAFCLRTASDKPGHLTAYVNDGAVTTCDIQPEVKADKLWFHEENSTVHFEHLFDMVHFWQTTAMGGCTVNVEAANAAGQAFLSGSGDAAAVTADHVAKRTAALEVLTVAEYEKYLRKLEREERKAQEEAERLERERIEAEARAAAEEAARLEQERLEKERAEQERLAQEQRAEQERLAQEQRAEQERLAQERAEQERIEQERAEQERAERERAEQLQAAERAKSEAEAAERQSAERAAREEAARLQAERDEAAQLARQREAELLAAQQAAEAAQAQAAAAAAEAAAARAAQQQAPQPPALSEEDARQLAEALARAERAEAQADRLQQDLDAERAARARLEQEVASLKAQLQASSTAPAPTPAAAPAAATAAPTQSTPHAEGQESFRRSWTRKPSGGSTNSMSAAGREEQEGADQARRRAEIEQMEKAAGAAKRNAMGVWTAGQTETDDDLIARPKHELDLEKRDAHTFELAKPLRSAGDRTPDIKRKSFRRKSMALE